MEATNAMSTILSIGRRITYFSQLTPIEVMSIVEFEDEWIIDLGSCPDLTIQAKEEEKEQSKKVAGVDLSF